MYVCMSMYVGVFIHACTTVCLWKSGQLGIQALYSTVWNWPISRKLPWAPVCASHLAVRAQGFQTCAAMPVFPVALGISQVFILTHSAQPAPCSLTYSGFVRVVGMNMVWGCQLWSQYLTDLNVDSMLWTEVTRSHDWGFSLSTSFEVVTMQMCAACTL